MTIQEWLDAGAPGTPYWFDTPEEGCPVGGTFMDDGNLVARVRERDIPYPCGIECCGVEHPQYVYVPTGITFANK